jgi:predicted phage tail protein
MKQQDQQWISTAEAIEALGVGRPKLTRLMNEAGIKRVKLAARDMRTWYIAAEDMERLRAQLATPRPAKIQKAGSKAGSKAGPKAGQKALKRS